MGRPESRTNRVLIATGVIALVLSSCSATPELSVRDEATPDASPQAPDPSASPPAQADPDPAAPTPSPAPVPEPTLPATSEPAPIPTPTQPPVPTSTPEPEWSLTIEEIDAVTRARIEPTSWRPGCPVGLSGLRLLSFPYVDFDGGIQTGEMIVAATFSEDIGAVFEQLFLAAYPIQRIELVDEYGGSDEESMQANNTSAFNCREVGGKPGVWSNHALGAAVDLNPLMNPYVEGGFVSPAEGAEYVDRADVRLGMVVPGDAAVEAFAAVGWRWGGNWVGLKDYQHFSANGR